MVFLNYSPWNSIFYRTKRYKNVSVIIYTSFIKLTQLSGMELNFYQISIICFTSNKVCKSHRSIPRRVILRDFILFPVARRNIRPLIPET